jgi:hypothetical protein
MPADEKPKMASVEFRGDPKNPLHMAHRWRQVRRRYSFACPKRTIQDVPAGAPPSGCPDSVSKGMPKESEGSKPMTANLAEKTCTPCRGGVPPLTIQQAEEVRVQAPEWPNAEVAEGIRHFQFLGLSRQCTTRSSGPFMDPLQPPMVPFFCVARLLRSPLVGGGRQCFRKRGSRGRKASHRFSRRRQKIRQAIVVFCAITWSFRVDSSARVCRAIISSSSVGTT